MARKHLIVIAATALIASVALAAGEWKQVGKAGDWAGTISGVVLGGKIYTAESSGALYATNLKAGSWKQLGKADFKDTAVLFAVGDLLYSIEASGSLFEIQVK